MPPLTEFQQIYEEQQLAAWTTHYIDVAAVHADLEARTLGSSGADVDAGPLLLGAEAARALTFLVGQAQELEDSVAGLPQEIDKVAAAEREAGAGAGTFVDERAHVRQNALRAWAGAEQLAAFAALNYKAVARLAKHADHDDSSLSTGPGAAILRDPDGPAAGLLAAAAALAPHKARPCDFAAHVSPE